MDSDLSKYLFDLRERTGEYSARHPAPVATAVLLERRRLRDCWLAVESAADCGDRPVYDRAMAHFRAALDLDD